MHNSQTKFRRAKLSDLEYIVDLGANLAAKHGAIYGVEADPLSVADEIVRLMRDGIVLVGDGAAAGGVALPFLWGHKERVGMVTFWNFTKPSGIHILSALILELEKMGATCISTTSHYPKNRIGEYYERLGMHPAETTYVGEIATIKNHLA